jgi:hypothetical protein
VIRRRLLNFASAVSLLSFIAIVVLWVRSYHVVDTAGRYREQWVGNTLHDFDVGAYSEWGGLRFFLFRRSATIDPADATVYLKLPATQFTLLHEDASQYPYMDKAVPGFECLGFGIYHGPRKQTMWCILPRGAGYGPDAGAPPISPTDAPIEVPLTTNDAFILVPDPFVMLITAMLPAYWVIRRHRYKSDCCTACGYNLTANTSGVCPECGMPVSSKPEAIT